MKTLLVVATMASALANPVDSGHTLTTFEDDTPAFEWYVVNDNVMGGRSLGGFEVDNGHLRFSGALNTNGGGFASIRTRPVSADLSGAQQFRLRVRGDGRTYKLRLMTRTSRAGYSADFTTTPGEWLELTLPIDAFVPTWRGRRLDLPPVNPADIASIGFMIADGIDGPFSPEVDRVAVERG